MVPHLSHIPALLLGKLVTRKHILYTVYFTLQHVYTVCINRSTKVRRCVGLQVEDVCYVEQTSILKNNSIALPYLERDCCTKYWEYDTQTLQQVSNSCSISEMSKVVTSHIDINRLPNGKGVDQNLVVFPSTSLPSNARTSSTILEDLLRKARSTLGWWWRRRRW